MKKQRQLDNIAKGLAVILAGFQAAAEHFEEQSKYQPAYSEEFNTNSQLKTFGVLFDVMGVMARGAQQYPQTAVVTRQKVHHHYNFHKAAMSPYSMNRAAEEIHEIAASFTPDPYHVWAIQSYPKPFVIEIQPNQHNLEQAARVLKSLFFGMKAAINFGSMLAEALQQQPDSQQNRFNL